MANFGYYFFLDLNHRDMLLGNATCNNDNEQFFFYNFKPGKENIRFMNFANSFGFETNTYCTFFIHT